MVQQHDGQTWLYYQRYSAEKAQQDADHQASGKRPGLKIGKDHRLAATIERCVRAGESPDVIAWRIRSEADADSVTLCTKTIYRYLYANLFLHVSWQDLILGPYRKRPAPGTIGPCTIRSKDAASKIDRLKPKPARTRAIGRWIWCWAGEAVAVACCLI